MVVDLVNNNTTGNLIAFVKMGEEQYYCLAEVEYWVAEWWNAYVDLDEGTLESLYFTFLNRFKLDYSELRLSYNELLALGNQFKIEGNKPSIFIDFDLNLLKFRYLNGIKKEHVFIFHNTL
jgi:hypothetical protein